MVNMSPSQHSQPHPDYDFIMNSSRKPAKKPILPSGNSAVQRITIAAGGGFVLLILIMIAFSLFSSDGGKRDAYLSVAQSQSELARIANLASTDTSNTAKNITVNIALTTTSDQKKLITVLEQNGTKFNSKDLLLKNNPKTDEELTAAKAAATYDTTLLQILDDQLNDYEGALSTAYDLSENQAVRQSLKQAYDNTQLLQKQVTAGTKLLTDL